jgi:hypothetical protein
LKYKILLILALISGSIVSYGQIEESLELRILDAFILISEAEDSGAYVDELVDSINQVIENSMSGDMSAVEAVDQLDLIIVEAERALLEGVEQQNLRYGITGLNTAVVLVLIYLVWRYFPRLYWRVWLRYRGHWLVK